MHLSKHVIDVLPIETEVLSPAEFIKLTTTKPSLIKTSKIIPGKLGTKNFGSFFVVYSKPIYKPA
ncbi:hypothetical protein [Paraburkholderia graminis]|uniref:hypothetical protein n=1 Tax=Paraburkholderia graminis TaxID=60548 RepID=UPI0038B8D239